MSSTPTVVLSVLLAAAAAVGVSLTMRPSAAAVAPTDETAELKRELAVLRADYAALQQRIDAVSATSSTVAAASERTVAVPTEGQVAAAVEAYLQRRDAKGVGGAANASAAGVAFDMEKDFAGLVGTSYWDDTDGWKKAFTAGRMDAVIAKFEALAKQNPNDIPTQMSLANAYMAYLQMDQSKWQYSMKADEVFDKVLGLDETHWEARFTKAMSYTFYPDFLGKKKDAISHFETLVSQQEKQPVESHHAQTYLFLGNLLEQRDPARAKEMWAKGARRHPDNEELRQKAGG